MTSARGARSSRRWAIRLGYLIVILGSHQLFTDNTLMPIVPLLAQPSRGRLPNVLRLWTAVLVANLIGAFLFATVLAQLGVIDPLVHQALGEIAREALGGESVAWGALLTGFLVPSLLGNELGGLAMVAALNHAQLTSSEEGA